MPDTFGRNSTVFEARFPGICDECDERFDAGTSVRYSFGSIVHGDPSECRPLPPASAAETCSKCFVQKPCFCD